MFGWTFMVKYLVLDLESDLIQLKKDIVIEFGKPLPNSIMDEIIFQVFDVFLNYGIRSGISDNDQTIINQLRLLPNNGRVDISVFLGERYHVKQQTFSNCLFNFSINVYRRLKEHIQSVSEFNFVVNKILHQNGRVVLEFFEY